MTDLVGLQALFEQPSEGLLVMEKIQNGPVRS
jgi:hypothetical protein